MRALVLAACVGLVACGGAATTSRAPRPPAPHGASTPPLRSFVLLKPTAQLRIAADVASPPLQLFASEDEANHAAQDDASPVFRVIEERATFVEIETMFDAEHFCHDGLLGVRAYRLRFFVARDDLALVTTRGVDVDYADGTGVTLSAGVTVRDVGGAIEANPSGHWFTTPLDGAAIGDSFEASAPFVASDPSYGSLRATPKHGVRFAGVTFPSFPSTHLPAFAESVTIDHVTKAPDGRIFAFVLERCARYRVLVDPSDVDDDVSGVGGLGLFGTSGGGFDVRRGATIYWKNGRIAGATREELVNVQGAVESGKRWCWPVALRAEGGPTVDVCVDEANRM